MARGRPSLLMPILFGVLAICFTIAVLVAWNIIFTKYYLLAQGTEIGQELGVSYWLTLAGGCIFLVLVIATLATFLAVNIRQALYVSQQNTFIDSVTHELKSPLASILLSLDTMEMRTLSPERQKRIHQMMRADIDRLQAFIEHVLEASRLEQNAREVFYEPVSLPEIIDKCIARVIKRHKVGRDCFEVDFTLPDPNRRLITDPMGVELILLNLIDNAVKYSPEEVIVRVHVQEAEEESIQIKVQDQGMGLEKRQLKKVFRRFHRVTSEVTRRVRGVGLGLYVVRSLVKRLKGTIEVDSPGLNQGTTFTVHLPVQWHTTAPSPEPKTIPESHP